MGNSVIYRPAYDAEVEYLESTGTQYIDTGIVASSELGIIAHIAVMNDNTTYLFGGANGLLNAEYGFMAVASNNKSSFRFGSKTTDHSLLNIGVNYEFDNTSNHNVLTVGETSYQTQFNEFISSFNFYLFAENRSGSSWKGAGVRIYDFKIYQNSTLVRDFIPVRIGQIGYLYDKVSKQLFANKGTGNFILGNDVSNAVIPQQRCVLYFGNQRSVGFERIYEEYEWLMGDGNAYIDTGIIVPTEKFVCITRLRNRETRTVPNSFLAFTVRQEQSAKIPFVSVNPRTDEQRYYVDLTNPRSYVPFGSGTFDINITMPSASTLQGDLMFFRSKNMSFGNSPWIGDIATFSLTSLDSTFRAEMQPCKLLQSIPAILDGNGIARQAGECGMWDKVSNKFYGNVASSGTFTVKGPKCYEEFEWLNSVSGGEYITLAGGSNTDSNAYVRTTYKCNYNSRYFDISIGGSKNVSNNQCIRIFNISNITYIDVHKWTNGTQTSFRKPVSGGQSGVERSLYVTLTNWQVDNQSGTVTLGTAFDTDYNHQSTRLLFPNNSYAYKRTQMRTNNKEFDLIPCKLTHGIPASMDANGIARPAGTCGMWDKVNDVFYGNVASSGSFTVSND